ncbi:hypothetical protein [Cupriavidus necator]|uniref:hypothetical protein n=1 Tax=Cupriavidus necator TaxID=106590 RepID=UPI000B179694|nr:hypothetical protein [Cupriavidus necator]
MNPDTYADNASPYHYNIRIHTVTSPIRLLSVCRFHARMAMAARWRRHRRRFVNPGQ